MIRSAELGKHYKDGEKIVTQGDQAESMFIIQDGEVNVFLESANGDIPLVVLGPGDMFGEMSMFTKQPRTATVTAKGNARVLTVDKRGFLRRIHEDPSLAFRILQKLSERITVLNEEMSRLQETLAQYEKQD